MAQQEGKPEKRMTGTGQPPLPRGVMFWWLISLAVLIWYVTGLWPRSQSRAHIPYSFFLAQIRQDNVRSVHIAGRRDRWEICKTARLATGRISDRAIVETHAAAFRISNAMRPVLRHKSPTAYSEFTTIFPATVGDPDLMPLLDCTSCRRRGVFVFDALVR